MNKREFKTVSSMMRYSMRQWIKDINYPIAKHYRDIYDWLCYDCPRIDEVIRIYDIHFDKDPSITFFRYWPGAPRRYVRIATDSTRIYETFEPTILKLHESK